ncbi:MAG TPA: prolyl oligopeptidase family serine peptidase [Pyrinomonadaceae bacterium]|nr:prolyl oligopeptidase family serine peptidase [Pyrinomonadaceae bacterium]
MPKTLAPYGSWKSPITSDLIVGETVSLSQPKIDGSDIYWLEMRPSEGGRNVLVCRDSAGNTRDVTAQPFNVRTRVHEYGGGDYVVNHGAVYFSNFLDQRMYRWEAGSAPRPITPPTEMRYADAVIDHGRGGLICVREDHTDPGREASNTIVRLSQDGNHECGQVLAAGYDFYSSPRISPDGSRLAWLSWRHPNMPWDGCELWVGEFKEDGSLTHTRCVAGSASESIFQPEWSPDGLLYFVSERTGWWNLYRLGAAGELQSVFEMEAEFGLPQWLFGMTTYGFASAERIVCSYIKRGICHLAMLDTQSRLLLPIESTFTDIAYVQASQGEAVFRAGSPSDRASIVRLDVHTGASEILRRSNNVAIDEEYISVPEAIEFPTAEGLTAHAFFYEPKNPDYSAPAVELPPLLVKSHGGPTSAASTMQSLSVQFWTSRGIAVLDVNYGGGTGYGREYRRRLNGKWGIVDVDDCTNGALYLANAGRVDAHRLMITGGSAGGYTTLCALTFRKTFKAGASYFGVSDAEALAKDTHKFESRYLDGLMGPYPERRDIYYARSPINFTGRLSCPVIFFQGLEDKVVPASQAELMVEALRAKRIPVAYLPFPGEQHGFRQAQNIKRALDAELYFYSRVFGFELADEVEPVEIENLSSA